MFAVTRYGYREPSHHGEDLEWFPRATVGAPLDPAGSERAPTDEIVHFFPNTPKGIILKIAGLKGVMTPWLPLRRPVSESHKWSPWAAAVTPMVAVTSGRRGQRQ